MPSSFGMRSTPTFPRSTDNSTRQKRTHQRSAADHSARPKGFPPHYVISVEWHEEPSAEEDEGAENPVSRDFFVWQEGVRGFVGEFSLEGRHAGRHDVTCARAMLKRVHARGAELR